MRRAPVLGWCALLVCASGPVLAQGTLYDDAREARLAGQSAHAIDLLEQWLVSHPDDTDALVQYGYALLAIGRIEEAERTFDRVLVLAPGYGDAITGKTQAAARRADSTTLGRAFVQLEGTLSNLEPGQEDWKEIGIAASFPMDPRTTLNTRGTWYERFGVRDVEFGSLATHRVSGLAWMRLGVSAVPSADFRPAIGIEAGADMRIAESTIGSLDAAWQQFPSGDVWTFRPSVTRYFGSGRYALAADLRAVSAESSGLLIGGSLRGDFFPQDRNRLYIGIAAGPETDLGEVRDTTSFYGGGETPLTSAVSVLGSFAREWRATGSDRTEVRVGVKVSI